MTDVTREMANVKLMQNNMVRKYGFEAPLTVKFCSLCEDWENDLVTYETLCHKYELLTDYNILPTTLDEKHDFLVDNGIATHEEIILVACINGWSDMTMNDILEVRTGYKNFESYLDSLE